MSKAKTPKLTVDCSVKQLLARARRWQLNRQRKAGKHECVKVQVGTARRLTARDGRTLKRPVTIARFYECKICGRNMKT